MNPVSSVGLYLKRRILQAASSAYRERMLQADPMCREADRAPLTRNTLGRVCKENKRRAAAGISAPDDCICRELQNRAMPEKQP